MVYADPPYAKTTGYKGGFEHGEFWRTMSHWVDIGATVFVSEYTAPPSFRVAFEVATKTDIRTNAAGKESRIERLFVPADADYGR